MTTLANDSTMILIVDSDPFMLTAVAAMLNLSGYECLLAREDTTACRAVETAKVDLVIDNLDADAEQGIQRCQRLRELAACPDLPFIFISGETSPDIVRRTHQAGNAYYLRKPYDPEVLLELVEKSLWLPHLVRSRIERPETRPPKPKSALSRRAASGLE